MPLFRRYLMESFLEKCTLRFYFIFLARNSINRQLFIYNNYNIFFEIYVFTKKYDGKAPERAKILSIVKQANKMAISACRVC